MIAVYTLSIAVAGLQQLGAPVWFEPVFNGTALVVAVACSQWALRQRANRAKARELAALDQQLHQESLLADQASAAGDSTTPTPV